MTQVSEQALDAAFTFARKLRDRDFLKFLASNGYESEQDIVIALPDEPTTDVFRRMFNQAAPPAIIAIWRPSDPRGFVFMTTNIAAVRGDGTADENVSVGAGATIGMLYDAFAARSDSFKIPDSWVQVRRLASA